jgi:CrcB protein
MSALTWVAVGAVGGVGSVARMQGTLWLGRGVPLRGTFAVNLTGAFALGLLAGAGVTGDALLIAGTGLLGAFTTFSTWMHEVVGVWQEGRRRASALLLVGALLGGLAAAALGRVLGAAL